MFPPPPRCQKLWKRGAAYLLRHEGTRLGEWWREMDTTRDGWRKTFDGQDRTALLAIGNLRVVLIDMWRVCLESHCRER